MNTDNLHNKEDVRNKLAAGIKKVSDAVGGTMGAAGYNGLIEAIEQPGYALTNDGITIAEAIHLADPIEDMGRKILVEAISRANKQSGDGSSTTCVLTSSIIEEGLKAEGSPMEIKKSLEACVPLIEEAIKKQTRTITVDDVEAVATVSAEDPKIGAMIQEIYQQIGKEGIIHWDISKTFEDHYTIGKGITIEGAGFVSPYMADLDESTGQLKNSARWTNPKILLTKQKITSAADFNELFQGLFAKDIKEIVVFCDEYEANVVADLVRTRAVRGFKTLLIKMPVLWKDWYYEDIAKATGATIIDPVLGLMFKTMTQEHLGTVEHITVDKENTYLDGIKDVSEYVKKLEEENTDESKLRASRLNTKTARYYVGAPSESALSHRRYKVEDAISASWQALQGGIVAGGGLALVNTIDSLPFSVGGQILRSSLLMPYKQISTNAGFPTEVEKLPAAHRDEDIGFDSKTGQSANMFEAGIVDPANITLNCVRNAVSVAASVLTANIVVLYPRPNLTEQIAQNLLTRQQ